MVKPSNISKTYIIVLNWNNYKDTIECFESLLKLNYDEFQIILCDNNSQDESIKHITNWAEEEGSSTESTIENLKHLCKPISYCILTRLQSENSQIGRAHV